MPDSILESGIIFILSLQGLGDWLILPMNILTFTGNSEFYLLVLPALYWCWDRRLGLRVAIIFLLGATLNLLLKIAVHDPRPYWVDPQVRLLTEAELSFGVPSGHAQNSVSIWGMAATYLRTAWAWPIAILLIVLIGLSRMYLGVHYPSDVLAGWILGLIGLGLFLALERPVALRFNRLSEPSRIGLIFALSIGLILTGAWVSASVSASWRLPVEWIENAVAQSPDEPIAPLSLENIIVSAGTFFGLVSGAIIMDSRFSFQAGGVWGKRLIRYMIGVVGVIMLWQGLGGLFDLVAIDGSWPGYILRYIRYSLIGLWVSAIGPLLFIRLSLAQPQGSTQRSSIRTE
jgi:membrane-associated phospholipid phosphatase